MKFFHYGKDGGPESTVWGFWIVEIKSLFSIALLRFENGSREAYHNHAFNAISWLLSGSLEENILGWRAVDKVVHTPSLRPIWTPWRRFHKVNSVGRSWVLSFRGPWNKVWREYDPVNGMLTEMKSGRHITRSVYDHYITTGNS